MRSWRMKAERIVLDSKVLIRAALSPEGRPREVMSAIRSANGVLLFAGWLRLVGNALLVDAASLIKRGEVSSSAPGVLAQILIQQFFRFGQLLFGQRFGRHFLFLLASPIRRGGQAKPGVSLYCVLQKHPCRQNTSNPA